MHAYFRAPSEMWAEFVCRIWCSPSRALFFLGFPPCFPATVVYQNSDLWFFKSVSLEFCLNFSCSFSIGTWTAGHETYPEQIFFPNVDLPLVSACFWLCSVYCFFILCPELMFFCVKIGLTIQPLLKVEPLAFYSPSIMVNMGHLL